jgi:quercetin dioxygenase-like cupin family protein
MSITIPSAVRSEHEELHAELAEAILAGGQTGDAAKTVARLMHPHFIAEEQFALPPLGLLKSLVAGDVTNHAAEAIAMTDRLRSELPRMLDEHRAIVAALDELATAASYEQKPAIAAFARKLIQHATMEEQVLYPAALLVGERVKSMDSRPMAGVVPTARLDLDGELDRMRAAEHTGAPHLAKTLVRSPSLRLVLMTMEAGARITEHRSEGAITIQVIDGSVRLHQAHETIELAPGQVAALEPDVAHSLSASERSGVLLTIAWTGHHRPT